MPTTPLRSCRFGGCKELTGNGWCDKHLKAKRKVYDANYRPERHAFYSSKEWRNLKRWQINNKPTCAHCFAAGRNTLAELVHHILPIETHWELRLDANNLESLCSSCHSRHHAAASYASGGSGSNAGERSEDKEGSDSISNVNEPEASVGTK